MLIGYARVSTRDQNLDMQLDALKNAGCEQIFQEKVSGKIKERPELDKMLAMLRKGDTIVFYKLDRLARSLKHLVEIATLADSKGINLKCLNDPIDTTSASGRFVFNMFAAFAEFEREIITERVSAGLKSARARGRVGGRPKGLSDKAIRTANIAAELYIKGELGVNQIAEHLNISKSTLYKYLEYKKISISAYNKKQSETKRTP